MKYWVFETVSALILHSIATDTNLISNNVWLEKVNIIQDCAGRYGLSSPVVDLYVFGVCFCLLCQQRYSKRLGGVSHHRSCGHTCKPASDWQLVRTSGFAPHNPTLSTSAAGNLSLHTSPGLSAPQWATSPNTSPSLTDSPAGVFLNPALHIPLLNCR